MTHQTDPELLNHVLQLLTEQGHDGFAEGLRLLVNEAMRVERHHVLQAQPYERTDTRKGYANGYKPKTLASRIGPITFSVPQVRGETNFYPSALEKGIRSEQALKLALAEMYVQGVSTRKVSAIVEELCGMPSVPPRSATAPNASTPNFRNGATARWGPVPIWCSTPATKKSATTASFATVPSSSPWASRPRASAPSSA